MRTFGSVIVELKRGIGTYLGPKGVDAWRESGSVIIGFRVLKKAALYPSRNDHRTLIHVQSVMLLCPVAGSFLRSRECNAGGFKGEDEIRE